MLLGKSNRIRSPADPCPCSVAATAGARLSSWEYVNEGPATSPSVRKVYAVLSGCSVERRRKTCARVSCRIDRMGLCLGGTSPSCNRSCSQFFATLPQTVAPGLHFLQESRESKLSTLYFQHLQNRSAKTYVHATHTVH